MTSKRTSGLPLPLGQVLEAGLDGGRQERLWANIRARRGMGGHSEPPKAYLPVPLSAALTSDDVAGDRSRLWRQIAARRREKTTSRTKPVYAFSFGMAALAAALLVFWLLPQHAPTQPGAVASVAPPPLLKTDGTPMAAVETTAERHVVRLADASEIRLSPGTRLEPLLSSASRFELLLKKGSAEFSVTPNGPRRWVIEAGLATVEVVGTVFRVTRSDDKLEVQVSRGVVLVRGDAVPGRVQRLTAGESIAVSPDDGAAAETSAAAPEPEVAPESGHIVLDAIELGPLQAPSKTAAAWRAHVRAMHYAAAYAALGDQGLSREIARSQTVEELLELADVARLSGHPIEAVPALERALSAYPTSPQAALAAFTLGRVQLEQLGDPKAAAGAFERAVAMRPPHALLADCHARLVEAYARAGDAAAAERAKARYRTMFPSGRHSTDLDRWTNE